MRILYLLPSLEYGGAATQAALLGRELAKSCDVHVCALSSVGPWAAALCQSGVALHCLAWGRPFDPRPAWHLRRLVAALDPDCIQVWRLPALRALAWAGRKFLARCVVSQALPTDRLQPWLGTWDRWLLQRVAKLVAADAAEGACLERLGFAVERVAVIPPGVEARPVNDQPACDEPTSDTAIKPGRRIACVGNLENTKGFREAIRAADYLTYAFADMHLEIIGSGPALPSLQRFREGAYYQDHLHLLGARADAPARLARADICWVPSLTATGRHVALEAMAAGRPVVATDLPHFREMIVDGMNGLLVPIGDKTALARRTRQLLLDDGLRQRLGEAARITVRDRFSAARCMEGHRVLYQTVSSGVFPQTPIRSGFSIAGMQPSRNNALEPIAE